MKAESADADWDCSSGPTIVTARDCRLRIRDPANDLYDSRIVAAVLRVLLEMNNVLTDDNSRAIVQGTFLQRVQAFGLEVISVAPSRSLAKSRLFSLVFGLLFLVALSGHQVKVAPARITRSVDESDRVFLHDPIHNLARPEFDHGTVPSTQQMNRIMLLLQRSEEQESELREMLDEQQTKASRNYHRWLTPKEFGTRFGPSNADIWAVTNWLTQHGFKVGRVSEGKTVIEFSGTVGQLSEAFRTQIHSYTVEGHDYVANSSEPSVPAALAPVIVGFVSLNNFRATPAVANIHRFGQQGLKSSPSYTTSNSTTYAVGPYDFATIYNSLPLWNSSPAIDGTGQSIAVVERSDICTSGSPDFGNGKPCGMRDDILNFRSYFGLPTVLPGGAQPVVVVVNGPNPGIIEPSSEDSAAPDDEREAILDAEVAGGVARNAQILLVVSQSTEATGGDILSAEYIIDNNLAPVMSVSFLSCEANDGSTFNILWEQAAAQGITVTVSAGDSGSAGCDAKTASAASQGLAVNGIASTPFNVAVGGSDFADANNQGTYWSSSNAPGTHESALSYIPEIPWNNSCAANGFKNGGCSSVPSTSSALTVLAGGGGSSRCPSGVPISFCAKPPWQGGPVLPAALSADGTRDLPDVVLFSSVNSQSESAYAICISDANSGDHACPPFFFEGGTSASAPAFAGVMALVNQFMASQGEVGRQGNANYVLYALANRQVNAGTECTSSSVSAANSCTFYDITQGYNSVPCVGGSPNCSSATVGTFGELVDSSGNPAWGASIGFDLASGLGSVNVANLVRNWASAVGTFESTTTSLQLCSQGNTNCVSGGSNAVLAIVHGTPINVNITVAPANPGMSSPGGDSALIGLPDTSNNNGGSLSSSASYFSLPAPTLIPISGGGGKRAINNPGGR
jgi:subtilase family serine protease